jgi:hypothetical protein
MKRGCRFFILLILLWGFHLHGFGQGQPTGSLVLSESFSDTIFPRPGWIADGVTRITTASAYYSAPAVASFGTHNGTLTLPDVSHPELIRFWLGRTTATTPKLMIVEVSDDGDPTTFQPVDTFDHDNTDAGTFVFLEADLSAYSHIPAVTIRFRKASSTTSPWRLDDLEVYAVSSLPVTLSTFYGEHQPEQGVVLHWSTASELQNSGFTILRCASGESFSRAGAVLGSGTTDKSTFYTWFDPEPFHPATYYQLVQTDYDGSTDTLKTLRVITGTGWSWDVQHMVPESNSLTINFNDNLSGRLALQITDMQGRILHASTEMLSDQKIITLTVKLLPGVYVLLVSDSTHRVTRKFSVDP